jgi:hypothetical protein
MQINPATEKYILEEAVAYKREQRFSDQALAYFKTLFENFKNKKKVIIDLFLSEDTLYKQQAIAIIEEVISDWRLLNAEFQ